MVQSVAEYRRERNRGQVVDFDRNNFDASASFYRIGDGSLGGKARGIAFINHLLNEHHLERRFPGVAIFVPTCVVLSTEVFDRFLEENALGDFAIQCEDEDALEERFQRAAFPRDLTKDLKVFSTARATRSRCAPRAFSRTPSTSRSRASTRPTWSRTTILGS